MIDCQELVGEWGCSFKQKGNNYTIDISGS